MMLLIWGLTLVALLLWSLMAWGSYALLSGSGDWLTAMLSPLLGSAAWDRWMNLATAWFGQHGDTMMWLIWTTGAVTLLMIATVGTVLLRLFRRRRGDIDALAGRVRNGLAQRSA